MKKKGLSLTVECRRFLSALLALTFAIGISAQQITVNGTVTDPNNEPLIGASVLQKGSTKGTTTDFDGKFTLDVPKGATIVVSYVGYLTKEVAAKPNLTIVLDENQQVLEDVVVIGYGSVKRKDVTTAISSVSTKDIDRRPIVSAGEAIQGRAAGVSVVSPSETRRETSRSSSRYRRSRR